MTYKLTGVKTTSTGAPNPIFLNVVVPYEWLRCRDAANLLEFGDKFATSFTYGDGAKSDGKEVASVTASSNSLVMKLMVGLHLAMFQLRHSKTRIIPFVF